MSKQQPTFPKHHTQGGHITWQTGQAIFLGSWHRSPACVYKDIKEAYHGASEPSYIVKGVTLHAFDGIVDCEKG